MLYFKTRQQARQFKAKNVAYRVIDCGVNASRRWAVKVISV